MFELSGGTSRADAHESSKCRVLWGQGLLTNLRNRICLGQRLSRFDRLGNRVVRAGHFAVDQDRERLTVY
jgi:hypothetical protein